MHEANFFKTWKIPGACMGIFCRITMQPPLFELKLKTFSLVHLAWGQHLRSKGEGRSLLLFRKLIQGPQTQGAGAGAGRRKKSLHRALLSCLLWIPPKPFHNFLNLVPVTILFWVSAVFDYALFFVFF